MADTEETPEPADLTDVLSMVTELATVPVMGRRGRKLSLALAEAGHDIAWMEGLVLQGETYEVRVIQEYAPCQCADGRHQWHGDAPHSRGHWTETRRDAEDQVRRRAERRLMWERKSPVPHLVTRLVATTPTGTLP